MPRQSRTGLSDSNVDGHRRGHLILDVEPNLGEIHFGLISSDVSSSQALSKNAGSISTELSAVEIDKAIDHSIDRSSWIWDSDLTAIGLEDIECMPTESRMRALSFMLFHNVSHGLRDDPGVRAGTCCRSMA